MKILSQDSQSLDHDLNQGHSRNEASITSITNTTFVSICPVHHISGVEQRAIPLPQYLLEKLIVKICTGLN
jgi:hypothetical protein